MDNPEKPAKKR